MTERYLADFMISSRQKPPKLLVLFSGWGAGFHRDETGRRLNKELKKAHPKKVEGFVGIVEEPFPWDLPHVNLRRMMPRLLLPQRPVKSSEKRILSGLPGWVVVRSRWLEENPDPWWGKYYRKEEDELWRMWGADWPLSLMCRVNPEFTVFTMKKEQ
jgi:hypothetical protein